MHNCSDGECRWWKNASDSYGKSQIYLHFCLYFTCMNKVSTALPAVVVFPDVHRSSRDIHQPIQETRFLHGERCAGVPKSQCIRDTTACVSKQFTYKLSSQLHPLFCYCPLLRLCSSSPCLWSLFNGKRLLPVRS